MCHRVTTNKHTHTHTHIYIISHFVLLGYIPNASHLQMCGSKSKMSKKPAVYWSDKVLWDLTSFPVHIFVTPFNCFQNHASFWRFPFSNAQLRHSVSELLWFRPSMTGDRTIDVITALSKVPVTFSLPSERQQSPLHKICSSVAH